MTASDEQLMLAVAEGDLDAFDEVVRRYQKAAWNIAHRSLSDPAEAADVAQEAFLKILAAAPRYQPSASFRTYFYRVVIRLCIDHARKKRPVYTDTVPDKLHLSRNLVDGFAAGELAVEIREAVDALPQNQRTAIVLRHWEGLRYAEIAEVMDITVKAVEGLLGRARANLQARLAHLKES